MLKNIKYKKTSRNQEALYKFDKFYCIELDVVNITHFTVNTYAWVKYAEILHCVPTGYYAKPLVLQ